MPRSACLAALAALGVLLAGGCGDGGGASTAKRQANEQVRGANSVARRFGGIPQHGASLGWPDAPYTLVEFADLQCPFCARFDTEALSTVIERFVRTRRLRIELRPIAFLGPDSAKGAAATVAAGMQDRMWQFADLFYRNQGRENSGYVTPRFIGRIAKAAVLDIPRLRRGSGSRELRLELEANARAARTARITGTPGFRLGRTGGVLTTFQQGPIERRNFLRRLEAAIGTR